MQRVEQKRETLAAIVGTGLVGSAVFENVCARAPEFALILIDPDMVEEGTRQAPAFRDATLGVSKVEWLLGRPEARKAASAMGVREPVQALGEGFWQWLKGQAQRVVIFDCTDTSSAHCFISEVPRVLASPIVVQTGVAKMRGMVRVLSPARKAACFRCLGIRPNDQRNSCLVSAVSVNPHPAPATVAHGETARSVAYQAVSHALKRPSTKGRSYEVRIGELRGRWTFGQILLPRSPGCEHPALRQRRVERLEATSAVPLAELFRLARSFNKQGCPVLRLRVPVALESVCQDCGEPMREPLALGTGRLHRCANCGSVELLTDRHQITRELREEQAGEWSAADLGLPKWSWLTFSWPSGRAVTFELGGDARALVGRAI